MTGIGKHQKVSKHENDCRNQGLKKIHLLASGKSNTI